MGPCKPLSVVPAEMLFVEDTKKTSVIQEHFFCRPVYLQKSVSLNPL